jgi:hypothetical protein
MSIGDKQLDNLMKYAERMQKHNEEEIKRKSVLKQWTQLQLEEMITEIVDRKINELHISIG